MNYYSGMGDIKKGFIKHKPAFGTSKFSRSDSTKFKYIEQKRNSFY